MQKIFLALLVILVFHANAQAATFVVTSNADAGPGTLREALTLAAVNGTNSMDYIHFNLPDISEAGRTVVLASDLPDLSSMLVIDGSSQNGSKIGLSDAKVILKTLRSKSTLVLFKGNNLYQIEFYGLYFLDTTTPCISDPDAASHITMQIANSKNIIVGDQNRGNVFNGYNVNLKFTNIDGIELADNLFGQSPYQYNAICSGGVNMDEVTNVTIGGPNKTNTFISSVTITLKQTQYTNSIRVINNFFGIYSDGITTNHSLDGTYFIITGQIVQLTDPKPKIDFLYRDNLMTHYGGSGGIKLYDLDGSIDFKHNWFGIDKTGTIPLNLKKAHAGDGLAIYLERILANVTIGDTDPNEGNKIAYTYIGISNWNSPNVKIIRNSFKCIGYKEYSAGGLITIPSIIITKNTPNYIQGTTAPGAVVDIFESDDCTNCSPETFIGTTTASASGDWQFNFSKMYAHSILANAHSGKQSSDFTKPLINAGKVTITNFDCGHSGKITGMEVSNTEKLKWINEKGEIVSTELELKNALPGRYKLIVGEYCTVESNYFTINDLRPNISDSFATIKQPDCAKNNGSITGIFAYTLNNSALSYIWYDSDKKQIGTNKDIYNLPAGAYTLAASSKDCTTLFGPVILRYPSGLNIDESSVSIQSTPCNQSIGSITKLKITGTSTLQYSWKNALNQVVATTPDLLNQPAGAYTLQVTDETGCGPIYSSSLLIPETNTISIDDTQKQITNSTCVGNNGSITGIKVTGATNYEWRDVDGNLITHSVNLTGVSPGVYFFTASNATCAKPALAYTVGQQANLINIKGFTKILIDATCGLNNGRLEVSLQFPVVSPKSYRWENAAGETVGGNSLTLSNIDAGTYSLFGTDDNGCERFLISYPISRVPALKVTPNSAIIADDQCSQKKGSITNIKITGGQPPYNLKWIDQSGQTISTGADLLNVPQGTYTLQVTDASGCPFVTQLYVIQNKSNIITAPKVNNIQLCGPGQAIINIINPLAGYRYRIYDSPTSAKPLTEQPDGKLSVDVKANKTYYTSCIIGTCESPRTPFSVTVGVSETNIANTFTPNGDGVNDIWELKGIENYPKALVQVFNRYGQKVYESIGYARPFDGTINNQPLPSSTYYYIVNLGQGCHLFSGSLTLIR